MKAKEHKAEYTIQEPFKTITVKGIPLSVKKCLQAIRIASAGKLWKGYRLMNIEFSADKGLESLFIKKMPPNLAFKQ